MKKTIAFELEQELADLRARLAAVERVIAAARAQNRARSLPGSDEAVELCRALKALDALDGSLTGKVADDQQIERDDHPVERDAVASEEVSGNPGEGVGGLVYLASPYSHRLTEIRDLRHFRVCMAAAALMRRGIMVFSPIAHSHPIVKHGGLPTGWDWWQKYERLYIDACSRMIVLQLDGWEESRGVQDEIRMMQEMGKAVEYMTLEDALDGAGRGEGASDA